MMVDIDNKTNDSDGSKKAADIRVERMIKCARALEWYMAHPEAMHDDFAKVLIEVVSKKIKQREAQKTLG